MFTVTKEELMDAYQTLKKSMSDVINDSMITVKLDENCYLTRAAIKNNQLLTTEKLLQINREGKSENGETVDGRFFIDCMVFHLLPKVNCVIHLTSRYCSVWAQSGENLPPISYQQVKAFGGEIVCSELPLHRDGSQWQEEIACKVGEAIQSREADSVRALFINKFEALVFGENLEEAVSRAILLEEFAYQAQLSGEFNNGEYIYLPYTLIEQMNENKG